MISCVYYMDRARRCVQVRRRRRRCLRPKGFIACGWEEKNIHIRVEDLTKKVIFLLSLIVTVLVSETNRLEGGGGGGRLLYGRKTQWNIKCEKRNVPRGQVNKRFFSLFAPIGSCVSCAGHEETYFSQNFFSFFLDKNSIHSTFIVRCLRGKMGGDFQGVPPLCVYFSLCGGCIASAFVRSSGSRLSGIFLFFFRSANEEYREKGYSSLVICSRIHGSVKSALPQPHGPTHPPSTKQRQALYHPGIV